MRREAHEAASESCEKTGWGAPECPEKLSQVKSRGRAAERATGLLRGAPAALLQQIVDVARAVAETCALLTSTASSPA